MTKAVSALIVVGLALVVLIGVGRGIDALSAVILVAIVAFGALCIEVARRAAAGGIGPVSCPECGGVVSAHAPYCKHCGAQRTAFFSGSPSESEGHSEKNV